MGKKIKWADLSEEQQQALVVLFELNSTEVFIEMGVVKHQSSKLRYELLKRSYVKMYHLYADIPLALVQRDENNRYWLTNRGLKLVVEKGDVEASDDYPIE